MPKSYKIFLYILFVIFSFSCARVCFACPFEVCLPGMADNITLPEYIKYFFEFGVGLAGVLALTFLTIGGIQLTMSAGNSTLRSSAIDKIKNSILGLVLTLSSFILLITINPQLKRVEMPNSLAQIQGLYFSVKGAEPQEPALWSLSDTTTVTDKYDSILWPKTFTDDKGNITDNCNPNNPNDAYDIYYYRENSFKSLFLRVTLKCGKWADIYSSGSYIIEKRNPGIYFYDHQDCDSGDGSNAGDLPFYSAVNISSFNKNIKSIKIVNGPDFFKGPFFGVMIFNNKEYTTVMSDRYSYFLHVPAVENSNLDGTSQDDDYSRCINIPPTGETGGNFSIMVYQRAGYQKDGQTLDKTCDVTLYSGISYTGGNSQSFQQMFGADIPPWQKQLSEISVIYQPNIVLPDKQAEEKACSSFSTSRTEFCLHSIKTNGNCLVLLSYQKDENANNQSNDLTGANIKNMAQVLPVGTTNLEGEAVGQSGTGLTIWENITNSIEVIPLEVPLQ